MGNRVFRVEASIRQHGLVTWAIADTLEGPFWKTSAPPMPYAATWVPRLLTGPSEALRRLRLYPEESRGADQQSAMAVATELATAEALIFPAPLYGFGASQHFKTWCDVVCTDSRVASGATPVTGKPALLETARGGLPDGRAAW